MARHPARQRRRYRRRRGVSGSTRHRELGRAGQSERRAEIVADLRARGHRVVFVGDGINDAPALASADIGLTMGGGTEIAMETAQAAIISNDPTAVAIAIRLCGPRCVRSFKISFGPSPATFILVPLAALGIVQPIMAAAAMGVSSLFVVGNSLLLRRR